jgi:hypothetical protein
MNRVQGTIVCQFIHIISEEAHTSHQMNWHIDPSDM